MGAKENDKIKGQESYVVFYSHAENEDCQFRIDNSKKHSCERKIERPRIGLRLIVLGLIIPILLVLGIVLLVFLIESLWKYVLCASLIILLLFLLKHIVFFWVKIYQKYAPEKIRQACLFYPSCSQYMLLAIEKYGFWKGFYKGLKRIGRCHYPNGGEDYP